MPHFRMCGGLAGRGYEHEQCVNSGRACANKKQEDDVCKGASIYDVRSEGGGGKKRSKFADKQYKC